jgi:hypothetical protein
VFGQWLFSVTGQLSDLGHVTLPLLVCEVGITIDFTSQDYCEAQIGIVSIKHFSIVPGIWQVIANLVLTITLFSHHTKPKAISSSLSRSKIPSDNSLSTHATVWQHSQMLYLHLWKVLESPCQPGIILISTSQRRKLKLREVI